MKKFTFRLDRDPELPLSITPLLARMQIRICTEGYPEQGALYYEGTVKAFILERLPQESLIGLLPQLMEKTSFNYCLSNETIRVERI